jgi:hypothetical protein
MKKDSLHKRMVGMKSMNARVLLKALSAMGWTDSPLFLNRITAKAQTDAVAKAQISPL